jgi:predicted ATP-dependent endonuclease of OLD family
MQKILIHDFGPIREAEIEIRPITVLLGEQATGKSTIAQCVHFFLSLAEDFERELKIVHAGWNVGSVEEAVHNIIRSKFYSYYGSSKYLDKFSIKFYYNADTEKYIQINTIEDGSKSVTNVAFSSAFHLPSFCQGILDLVNIENTFMQRDRMLRARINTLFLKESLIDPTPPKYFPAGRNITTSYSSVFESYFTQNFRQPVRLGGRNIAKSAQMELISEFILHSADMKDKLLEFGGNIEEVFKENKVPNAFREDFIVRVTDILKGKYIISKGAEQIKVRSRKHIPLHFASSGQQESIRILQDLALLSAFIDNTHRTIEEPEAHLFPAAQTTLTELLVMTHNRSGSSFFLTTHSPYFLSSFNNLLYAAKAAGDNLPDGTKPDPDHTQRVEHLGYAKHLRLSSKNFGAYQLKDGISTSIFVPEIGLTDIDGLDAVSFKIAEKFQTLLEIIREAEEYETA